jgi:hypothetical protein
MECFSQEGEGVRLLYDDPTALLIHIVRQASRVVLLRVYIPLIRQVYSGSLPSIVT